MSISKCQKFSLVTFKQVTFYTTCHFCLCRNSKNIVIKCKSGRIFQKASITTLENIVFIIYVHRDNINFFVNLFEHRVLENHSTLYFPFNSVSCFAYSSASLDDVSSATKPQICDNVMKPFITTIRRGQITR